MITVGIDEVGRGCWAGPLVAGAVVLGEPINGLKDSKLLTKKQRQKLAVQINEKALAIGMGWVTPQELDMAGISTAVKLAMERALASIKTTHDEIIIDGTINYFSNNPKARALIRADMTEPAVSAASIIAKVARDTYMKELAHTTFPGYGFDQHVGYGTPQHLAKLKELGVTSIHRASYKPIKALLQ